MPRDLSATTEELIESALHELGARGEKRKQAREWIEIEIEAMQRFHGRADIRGSISDFRQQLLDQAKTAKSLAASLAKTLPTLREIAPLFGYTPAGGPVVNRRATDEFPPIETTHRRLLEAVQRHVVWLEAFAAEMKSELKGGARSLDSLIYDSLEQRLAEDAYQIFVDYNGIQPMIIKKEREDESAYVRFTALLFEAITHKAPKSLANRCNEAVKRMRQRAAANLANPISKN